MKPLTHILVDDLDRMFNRKLRCRHQGSYSITAKDLARAVNISDRQLVTIVARTWSVGIVDSTRSVE